MIIKYELLRHLSNGKTIGQFPGYYNMLEDWSNISIVYIRRELVKDLQLASSQRYDRRVTFSDHPESLSIYTRWDATHLKSRIIHCEGKDLNVYPVPANLFCGTHWVNLERIQDPSCFLWENLYRAIIEAVKQGLAAGMLGNKSIDGLLSEEWAWIFASRLSQNEGIKQGKIISSRLNR